MKKRVADLMVETLVENGITDCFGVIGGGAMQLYNAFALNSDIANYFNHNEQASAMAAEAYARISGRCAAVCVTSGPGATNVITGVVGAWEDSIPMVLLTGQVRCALSVPDTGLNLRYRGPQEFEIIPAACTMTKYAVRLTDPNNAVYELEKAIHIAMSGRRGPVWLDVPLDIQGAIVDDENIGHYAPEPECIVRDRIENHLGVLNRMIAESRRPVVLAGSGIISAHAEEDFERFVDKLGIPVLGASHVAESFYHEHPLYYGLSGDIGPRVGNFVLQNADLIIAVANSLGFRQTGYKQEDFAPHAKIVLIDIDEEEAKKPGIRVDHLILEDVKEFLPHACEYPFDSEDRSSWMSYCNEVRNKFNLFEGAEGVSDPEDRVSSYYFWKQYDKLAPSDAIVCLGCNSGCSSKVQIGKRYKGQRVITNYTIGSLGSDLPYSIGAAVATRRKVLCVTGDGGLMFNLQEMQTIRHYDLPISVVVFSNDGYNALRQTGKNFFNGKLIGCTSDTGVSFPKAADLAKTFGFSYRCCRRNGEVSQCLSEVLSSNERILLEVLQRYDDPVVPKLQSRMNADGTFESPALHDMWPFLPEEEIDELMIG